MLRQNYAMDFFMKSGNVQQAAMDFKKSDNNEKMGFPQFKDILNGSLNKPQLKAAGTESVLNHVNTHKSDRTERRTGADSNPRPQFRSYREVKESKNVASEKVEIKTPDASAANSKEELKSKEAVEPKTKEDVVIDTLSQVLGVSTNDLVKLLEAAGVNPEELANGDKAGEAIDKLATIINLNGTQKAALTELLSTLKDMIQHSPMVNQNSESNITEEVVKSKSALDESSAKEGWVKVKNVDITVIDNTKLAEEFKDIMAQMKVKLDALAEKLQKNPLEFKEEMVESLKTTLMQLSGEQETVTDTVATDGLKSLESIEASENVGEKQTTADGEAKHNSKDESNNQKDEERSTITTSAAAEVKTNQVDNGKLSIEGNTQTSNIAEVQGQKASVNEVFKAQKEINVPKSEIIEQVVNKAKVVLTADKSEMVMDLKPDSLGKLSLKVVTERGMVVAKFIAENHQVKEALETNMQLLKDSLEKQGLSVQGFSVSVRQDSYRGMNGNRQFEAEAKEEKAKTGITGGVNVSRELDLDRIQKANPYTWNDSQINLTA